MRLEAESTIATCERQLEQIVAGGDDLPLQIPTRARYLTAGGEAALTQLIISWAQRQQHPHIRTYAKAAEDPQINNLIRRLYGLTAAVCATRASGVSDTIDISAPLRKEALRRLESLQGPNPGEVTRGPSVEIVCVDHLNRGAPQFLYRPSADGNKRVRDRSEFRTAAKVLLSSTIPAHYLRDLDRTAADALGGMLYEVFKNTDDHALIDVDNNELRLSVRALKASYLSPTVSDLARIFQEFEPLGNYCGGLKPLPGRSQTHLFEMSVLDSGPGFAQSWTGKPLADMSPEEEVDAVRKCFSSGSSKRHERFGEGLPHVIRLLRRANGFLRLRTGRLSLYSDFTRPDENINAPLKLENWLAEDGKLLAPTSGSLITLIIPLRQMP